MHTAAIEYRPSFSVMLFLAAIFIASHPLRQTELPWAPRIEFPEVTVVPAEVMGVPAAVSVVPERAGSCAGH
jgi:hypothetical protein